MLSQFINLFTRINQRVPHLRIFIDFMSYRQSVANRPCYCTFFWTGFFPPKFDIETKLPFIEFTRFCLPKVPQIHDREFLHQLKLGDALGIICCEYVSDLQGQCRCPKVDCPVLVAFGISAMRITLSGAVSAVCSAPRETGFSQEYIS